MAHLIVLAFLLAAAATQATAVKVLVTQRHCSDNTCTSGCGPERKRPAMGECTKEEKSDTVKSVRLSCDAETNKFSYTTYSDDNCQNERETQEDDLGCDWVSVPVQITSKDGTGYVGAVCKRRHEEKLACVECQGKETVTFPMTATCKEMVVKDLKVRFYYKATEASLDLFSDDQCNTKIKDGSAKEVGNCLSLDSGFSNVQCVDETTTPQNTNETTQNTDEMSAASIITFAAVLLTALTVLVA